MGLYGARNRADQKRIHSWVGQPESVYTFRLALYIYIDKFTPGGVNLHPKFPPRGCKFTPQIYTPKGCKFVGGCKV